MIDIPAIVAPLRVLIGEAHRLVLGSWVVRAASAVVIVARRDEIAHIHRRLHIITLVVFVVRRGGPVVTPALARLLVLLVALMLGRSSLAAAMLLVLIAQVVLLVGSQDGLILNDIVLRSDICLQALVLDTLLLRATGHWIRLDTRGVQRRITPANIHLKLIVSWIIQITTLMVLLGGAEVTHLRIVVSGADTLAGV